MSKTVWHQMNVHFRAAFAAVFATTRTTLFMDGAAEMKQNKEQFLGEIYALAGGRFGVLIDSYEVGEKRGLSSDSLETIVDYLEAKGFVTSYEGTLYASLTLKGVEYVESLV